MTIKQEIQQKTKLLSTSSKTPLLDAETLLCHLIKKQKEFLYTHPEYELSSEEQNLYLKYVNRRLNGTPIAYITGNKEFYGRKFVVTPDTLIPRPETEMFIDFLKNYELQIINQKHNKKTSLFIDVGTGSGCILITLINELRYIKQKTKFIAIDISKEALKVAKQNAKKYNAHSIEFYHGNLLEPITELLQIKNKDLRIIITANLPYLTPKQISNSPSILQEPKIALVAGIDGLKYYKKLFKQISQIHNHESEIIILCEIDNSQAGSITKLSNKELPDFSIEIKKDLAGLSRLVILKSNQCTQI